MYPEVARSCGLRLRATMFSAPRCVNHHHAGDPIEQGQPNHSVLFQQAGRRGRASGLPGGVSYRSSQAQAPALGDTFRPLEVEVRAEGADGHARLSGDTWLDVHARIEAVRADIEANVKRLAECRSRLASTRVELANQRTVRQQLHDSAFARLQARLESLPVIEQAKGVLMAGTGCNPDEAFDILRRASQRTNVKVRDLAEAVVARASHGEKPDRSAGGVPPPCSKSLSP
jgi:hypothetical protein